MVLKKIFSFYFSIPLIQRILCGFVIGILAGLFVSDMETEKALAIINFVEPLGMILVSMLKMVVIPLIFFSLILGASALPLKKSGRLGIFVIGWYLLTTIFATLFGIAIALIMNPSMDTGTLSTVSVECLSFSGSGGSFREFVNSLFLNPFEALANGKFLSIVIFSIFFGLTARVLIDSTSTNPELVEHISLFLNISKAVEAMSFKLIAWVMEYFPVGVAALIFVNFARNGELLFSPYVRIIISTIVGVGGMILIVYPLAVFFFCRENPYRLIYWLREPMLMGFVTRSSAATLPVSFQTSKKLGISPLLSNFSLPLGCTINMDGTCIKLSIFVILAMNIYHLPVTATGLFVTLFSVVFASIGTSGIPGGSLFLLFMVLENIGLTPEQVGCIVALALGIDPILDMFGTACNITGDNVCTYIVAKRNGMIAPPDR